MLKKFGLKRKDVLSSLNVRYNTTTFFLNFPVYRGSSKNVVPVF